MKNSEKQYAEKISNFIGDGFELLTYAALVSCIKVIKTIFGRLLPSIVLIFWHSTKEITICIKNILIIIYKDIKWGLGIDA